MEIIPRSKAVKRLKKLIGKDLRGLADRYKVTVFKNGKFNKGWAGHTLECYLGLGLSSKQAPNSEFWELKVVPLIKRGNSYIPKETMAITMISADDVVKRSFAESHLLNKLRSLIICGRLFESKEEKYSKLISVGAFDLVNKKVWEQVRKDYELTQEIIRSRGFESLTGKMGVLIQPRTKGPGHGSTSRAFYARAGFVKTILGI